MAGSVRGIRLEGLALLTVLWASQALAGSFVAFSLAQAEGRVSASGRGDQQVMSIGGITRPAGVVFDREAKDIILVGQSNSGEKPISLDDFVVAAKAVFVHNTWPLVSIDKTPSTKSTGQQLVRFGGGIENTRFGRELLDADVVLKQLGLGRTMAGVWGVESYFDMFRRRWKETGEHSQVSSRFWFTAGEPVCASRSGVTIVKKSSVQVETEVLAASVDGKPAADPKSVKDEVGDRFAAAMTASYDDLCEYYPEVARVNALFNVVGWAAGIKRISQFDPSIAASLAYWLQSYSIPRVETPKEHPLVTRDTILERTGQRWQMSVDGGVELRALVLDLMDGSEDAFRRIVLLTRPSDKALAWQVPLEEWNVPGYADSRAASGGAVDLGVRTGRNQPSCSMTRDVYPVGSAPTIDAFAAGYTSPQFKAGLPEFKSMPGLGAQRFSPDVGGVMLRGAAKVSGANEAKVDLTGGNFSLVVGGENARLAPEAFRRFITALWSVYYSKQDPGISIDPIAPGVSKHMVRYIGAVVNNDLGRVMRGADYAMKKWAVGTERPDIPGFSSVDKLTATHGIQYFGASRRFWFVPKDMRFKRGGDALLFEDGKMTVQTEYVFQDKTTRAEPADEAFARFFTEHYAEIAQKYPVYNRLFDYAKLVSLAKYLKENGIPLYWFLMAYKDQVITEDSPGTVDALAKGSEYFEGVEIEGGVDLKTEGQYVYDAAAVKAISDALATLPGGPAPTTTLTAGTTSQKTPAQPFSFEFEKKAYSVVPQHTLTSGKDNRGVRYQTDLAFRLDGEPGLELVRYFDPRRPEGGEFGNGWRLLIPYRVAAVGKATREFLNARVPTRMMVENLLSGAQETLTFSTDRYSIAGYVPPKLESSQLIGLFVMSDASFRLADKLGNEFWFDQAGCLTDMVFFSQKNHIKFEYEREYTDAFEKRPYELKPAGDERVEILNALAPKRMYLLDRVSGDSLGFVLSDTGRAVGYVPEAGDRCGFKILKILTDASFRLEDSRGNELAFDAGGRFDGMAVADQSRPALRTMSQGELEVQFSYEYDKSNSLRIARAETLRKGRTVANAEVTYFYDESGRLCQVSGPMMQTAASR